MYKLLNTKKTDGSFVPKAVIFDMDGTLTDTEKYYCEAWPEAAAHFGLHMEPWMALELRSLGKPFVQERFAAWFGTDVSYDEIRSYRKGLVKEMVRQRGISLKPGCDKLLGWLKEQGILIVLATANDRMRAEWKLSEAGIIDHFDRICSADMVPNGKPAPDIYRFACRSLELDPLQTFAVEDSPNGIRSAYEAGCRVIMVPDLTGPDEETARMLYACADTLSDIIDLISAGLY